MATRNKELGRFLWLKTRYYNNLSRNKKRRPSAIYTLQELMDDRKYIKALMVANKKKKQQKKLVHVKLNLAA